MTIDDGRLLHDLAVLDPVRLDAPPALGSTRCDAVWARATGTVPTPTRASATTAAVHRVVTGRRALLALAAASVLVVAIVAAGRPGSVEPASAAEIVTQAARATGDASSFRGLLVAEENGTVRSSALAVDGADVQVIGDEDSSSFTVIGDQIWEDGSTTAATIQPEGRLAPFGPSSEAVVLAALRGGATTEVGEDEVRGQAVTHYRIPLDEASRTALRELSPGQLAWFELEYPDQALTVDVWVGDDLIRRIQVVSDWGDDGSGSGALTTTTEFYDFGADVTIEPPE